MVSSSNITPISNIDVYRGGTALMQLRATATTAQSQGVLSFVEKELPIEWVEVGV